MGSLFRAASYALTPIAKTGGRFTDFMPYVASINDHGVVAFQATLRGGGSGVYAGSGGPLSTIVETDAGPLAAIRSHPDLNGGGSACFYATSRSGLRAVVLVRDGMVLTLAEDAGPLGPTMNDSGIVAFRAESESGAGIFTGSEGGISPVAETGDGFSAFHGLPVINGGGAVVFRADRSTGDQGIYVCDGGPLAPVAETGEVFAGLGQFPILNDAGTVAFCATLHDGRSGMFIASAGETVVVLDSSGSFESFRGVLLDEAGRLIFYATPRGGELGVFTGPDPVDDCLLQLGAPLLGSTLVDFALNPVSINNSGQVAIRVKLATGLQLVLRADPDDRRDVS